MVGIGLTFGHVGGDQGVLLQVERLAAIGLGDANLGLSKMVGATNTHDYFQLSRLSRWHVESEAMARALAKLIEAQSALPTARF